MSRIFAALIIIASIVGLCFFEAAQVNRIIGTSNELIADMTDSFNQEDYDTAEKTAKKFVEYWEKNEPILCLFVSDDELDDIGVEVSSLPMLSGGEKDFLHTCNHIKNSLELLHDHTERIVT